MNSSLFPTFVVVFREALEASLIIGIILTVLSRLGARRYYSHIFASTALALITSFMIGNTIASMADQAQGNIQAALEGFISILACAVLTYVFFWMGSQARRMKSDLEIKVETALSKKDDWAMMSLAFFSVVREGFETVLFLKAVSIQSGSSASWVGGLTGIGLAAAIAVALFMGGKRMPIQQLFRWTGYVILLMAAGLLAYGIHELEEAGLVNPIIYPVYNINHILSDKAGLGAILKAIFGYNGNPSLVETVFYWTYLSVVAYVATRMNLKKENTPSVSGVRNHAA